MVDRVKRIHSQMIAQLHDPDGSANNLNNGEGEVEALHDGAVDGPFGGVGPFFISAPREVVEAEGRHIE